MAKQMRGLLKPSCSRDHDTSDFNEILEVLNEKNSSNDDNHLDNQNNFTFECPSNWRLLFDNDSSVQLCDDDVKWFTTFHSKHQKIVTKESSFPSEEFQLEVQEHPPNLDSTCNYNLQKMNRIPSKAFVATKKQCMSQPESLQTTAKAFGKVTISSKNTSQKDLRKPPVETKIIAKKSDVSSLKSKTILKSTVINKVVKGRPNVVTKDNVRDQFDMVDILRKHNERFVPVPVYEPQLHSVRDVRNWEKQTGKFWANLNPSEKEKANHEISQMKKNDNS